jgi:uncharacterized membrane protein YtjA (UPF0391 family)
MPAGNLLHHALVALVIALLAALLGFGGIAGAAAGIAQTLFYVFLVIFLVVMIMNFMGRRRRGRSFEASLKRRKDISASSRGKRRIFGRVRWAGLSMRFGEATR